MHKSVIVFNIIVKNILQVNLDACCKRYKLCSICSNQFEQAIFSFSVFT